MTPPPPTYFSMILVISFCKYMSAQNEDVQNMLEKVVCTVSSLQLTRKHSICLYPVIPVGLFLCIVLCAGVHSRKGSVILSHCAVTLCGGHICFYPSMQRKKGTFLGHCCLIIVTTMMASNYQLLITSITEEHGCWLLRYGVYTGF